MKTETPRILIVEDDEDQCSLIIRALVDQHPDWQLIIATRGREAVHCLETESFVAVLLDHQLPDRSGIQILREIIDRKFDVCVVFNTPFGNEQLAREALQAGATDYVQKSALMYPQLGSVLQNCIHIQTIKRQIMNTHDEVIQMERLSALSQLSLTLRHEINNPLAALSAYAELLMRDLKDQPALRKRVQQIHDEAMRIRDVLRRAEHVKDELQEYLPGLQMIRLAEPDKPASETKPERP